MSNLNLDVSLIDVVDYIEAGDDERDGIDGEFAGVPAECAALHVVGPVGAGCTGMDPTTEHRMHGVRMKRRKLNEEQKFSDSGMDKTEWLLKQGV
ncbi:MAG: hypothetical protein WC497_05540 [Patescibacteria group bacterium]